MSVGSFAWGSFAAASWVDVAIVEVGSVEVGGLSARLDPWLPEAFPEASPEALPEALRFAFRFEFGIALRPALPFVLPGTLARSTSAGRTRYGVARRVRRAPSTAKTRAFKAGSSLSKTPISGSTAWGPRSISIRWTAACSSLRPGSARTFTSGSTAAGPASLIPASASRRVIGEGSSNLPTSTMSRFASVACFRTAARAASASFSPSGCSG